MEVEGESDEDQNDQAEEALQALLTRSKKILVRLPSNRTKSKNPPAMPLISWREGFKSWSRDWTSSGTKT